MSKSGEFAKENKSMTPVLGIMMLAALWKVVTADFKTLSYLSSFYFFFNFY